jgi:hypothetical protein
VVVDCGVRAGRPDWHGEGNSAGKRRTFRRLRAVAPVGGGAVRHVDRYREPVERRTRRRQAGFTLAMMPPFLPIVPAQQFGRPAGGPRGLSAIRGKVRGEALTGGAGGAAGYLPSAPDDRHDSDDRDQPSNRSAATAATWPDPPPTTIARCGQADSRPGAAAAEVERGAWSADVEARARLAEVDPYALGEADRGTGAEAPQAAGARCSRAFADRISPMMRSPRGQQPLGPRRSRAMVPSNARDSQVVRHLRQCGRRRGSGGRARGRSARPF